MPYVNVPNDLNKIKTKMVMNLTRRQLLCFGGAAIVGIPTYLFTRHAVGNSAAMLVMIALMLPFFFIAMYERDGLPAEKVARNMIRALFIRPGPRPYKTENFYAMFCGSGNAGSKTDVQGEFISPVSTLNNAILNKEVIQLDENKKAPAAPAEKRQAKNHRAAHGPAVHPLPGDAARRRVPRARRLLHKDH